MKKYKLNVNCYFQVFATAFLCCNISHSQAQVNNSTVRNTWASNTSIKAIVATLFFTIFFLITTFLNGTTYVSKKSGNWSSNGTWIPSGVPGVGDDVLISNGHKVRINGNFACNSLTVGTSAITMSTLEFRGGAHSFTVFGNAIINAGDTLDIKTNSNTTHTITFYGDVTNNGGIQLFPDANSMCISVFMKNGNQMISGTGSFSKFYKMILNMGSISSNILEVAVSNFTVPTNFLTLTNGTLKITTSNVQNITTFTAATTMPSTAGLWLNSSNLTVNTGSDLTNSGKLTISNGTLNIGNAANEDLIYSAGSLSIAAGALNVAGYFGGSGNTTFAMTGGTMNVASFGSADILNAPFQMNSSSSIFNMSGGIIIVNREGGTGLQDLGYINLSTTGLVTGGTIQIGSSLAAIGSTLNINSAAGIGNLLVTGSNVTAKLNTNSINVIKDVTINSGILSTNNLHVSLGGNWQNNGGTLTAGTSSVIFNATSAQTIFKSGGEAFNHLVFNGAGAKSLLAPIAASGNITISSGSNLDVTASNYSILVMGNFINSGTFNSQSGLVFFNGTTLQTIGGSSTSNFFNITLNNNAGAILTNAENLIGTLSLNNGVFNTNSQVFTMVSTATATARIAQITGSGDINGNVKVQRFVPGGFTGWALIGTPISSALTLNDWDDNIAISCPTCPDGYVSGFSSIYTYDETATGTYSDAASYVSLSTINDPIVSNKGYWVYMGDGFATTNNITLDVTGTVRKQNQTIPLSVTNNASSANIGWNLIHNPYPSSISWAALRNSNTNVDNAIYVFNADLNGGAGANAAYVNGVSSPVVGSGGIGDVIPMCQGFYVHATTATNLTGQESNKVAGNPTFLRSASQSPLSIIRLNMKKESGYDDECAMYIQSGASAGFDADYDAIKMAGQDPYAPTIQIEEGNSIMQINGIAPVVGTFSAYIKTLTGYSGSYTISATDLSSFPLGTCFNLYDRFTSISTDITTSDYVFNLIDTTTVARFILNITLNPLQISSNLIQPTCTKVNGGEISAVGLNAGPWNYYWKDANNQIIKTTLNKSGADTLSGLLNGNVYLDVTTIGGCDNNQSNYFIIKKDLPYAGFLSPDTCYMNQNATIFCNNISANTVSQFWTFGDNIGTSIDYAPYYQYQAVGSYEVRLIANSPTGCIDTVVKTVFVSDRPVGFVQQNLTDGSIIIKSLEHNEFIISKNGSSPTLISYELIDAQGKVIVSEKNLNQQSLYLNLNLDKYNAGIYFLNIVVNNKLSVIKLPVNH